METITGYIDHIIYANSENGYTVMTLVLDSKGEAVTCVGILPGLSIGENIEATGSYVEHNVYGNQFKIETYRAIVPTDADGIERYLASGAVKGIGPTLAARIVKKFGDATFRIIEEEPERLAEIRGISERMACDIAARMEGNKAVREVFVFLQQYGISNKMAVRIHEAYKERVYQVLRDNPYRLAEDIRGIGFRIADDIALKAGIDLNSEFRIKSGITYALQRAALEGNTCLPDADLLADAEQILGIARGNIEAQLGHLAFDKKIVIRNHGDVPMVYDHHYFYGELKCARLLSDLDASVPPIPADEWPRIHAKINGIMRGQEMEADELQHRAVEESIRHGVVVISGGPGTGKTTIINSIIEYFVGEGREIALAAPTGRAAKRMTEATGYEAKTIHRLLGVRAGDMAGRDEGGRGDGADEARHVRFEHNEENHLDVDAVIVDEVSMVDTNLFLSLLKAIRPGTRLILVGDKDQLPSVGPGQVLHDIIASGVFATVMLEKIFRQTGESDIVTNAHRINHGDCPSLDNKSKDFFFLERNDANVIFKHMVQLVTEKLPAYVGCDPFEIQVLSPMRKGPLGSVNLNRILQEYLNPPDGKKKEYLFGEICFREGDKVMQVKNNYMLEWEILSKYGIRVDSGLGIYNGDLGIIREITPQSGRIVIEYDEARRVTYEVSQLDEIEPAYAITIHKSQGSFDWLMWVASSLKHG